MTTNLDRAQIVSRNVELLAVNLTAARLQSSIEPSRQPDELEVNQRYRATYAPTEDAVKVNVDFELEAAGEVEDTVESLELNATYQLIYRLPSALAYAQDALKHFAELNGPYNAWPYWRELVQTVAGRAGIAAIVIPVFRPPVRRLTDEEQLELDELETSGQSGPEEHGDKLT